MTRDDGRPPRQRRKGRTSRAQAGSTGRLILGDAQFVVVPGDPAWRIKYETYMSSPAWRATRSSFIEASGGSLKCASCGQKDDIALHHVSYDRLGSELLEDLIPMCPTCHQGVHDLHRSGRFTLKEATDRVISSGRMGSPHPRPEPPSFTPANQRNAEVLPDGRMVSGLDWREESRSIRGLTNQWHLDD